MNKNRATAIGVIIGAILALTTACNNKFTEPFKDAPRSGNDNGAPMDVIQMSDGFNNIGFKCVGHDGIYDTYHGDRAYAAVFVVPNDPNCPR